MDILKKIKILSFQDHEPIQDLGEMVKVLKPSVIIGAAAVPGVFTQEIIEDMAI